MAHMTQAIQGINSVSELKAALRSGEVKIIRVTHDSHDPEMLKGVDLRTKTVIFREPFWVRDSGRSVYYRYPNQIGLLGGFVSSESEISPGSYIGPNVIVQNSTLEGRITINGESRIYDSRLIGNFDISGKITLSSVDLRGNIRIEGNGVVITQ